MVARLPPWALVLLTCALALLVCPSSRAADEPARAIDSPPPAAAAEAVDALIEGVADEVAGLEHRSEGARQSRVTPDLTRDDAIAIADGEGRIRDWLADTPAHRTAAEFEDDERRWKVSYVGRDADGQERVTAVALVADENGEVTETRTSHQVAWMMARGYEGAFGRAINRPQLWVPLMVLFFVSMISLRRLISLRTLDLLVLLSFSVSLIWFNRGEIETSVPLVYPPLIYLALRLGWIAYRRSDAAVAREPARLVELRRPRFCGWAPTWLLTTVMVVAVAYRYGLNAFNSNVVDVGYAGVIGADRILSGVTPYGNAPEDCGRCDTYGPLTYITYLPFELAQPWSGQWDSLPAAHGAAVAFDVLAIAGLIALGHSLGGWRLGIALGTAWATFPFTAYTLENNANDALVSAALIWGLVGARIAVVRGLMLGLAIAAKFTPAILLLLWLRNPFPRSSRRELGPALLGLLAAVLLTGWVLLLDGTDGIRAFYSRTLGYQAGRDSPFSIWGLNPDLRPAQIALIALFILGALALARWPRRLDLLQMIALSGVMIIALELTLSHWFYLYIPWFLPFALVALLPDWPARRRDEPHAGRPPRRTAEAGAT
ncbi:MAG: DUF2029 domain-containing protein [Thermoleophilia bacterium]|nr:DUF2029 domain-containing protein [Thermoleophilia bacterium]